MLEDVCTRVAPRSSHRPASGSCPDARGLLAERLELREQSLVTGPQQPAVEEGVGRRENRGPVDVVLHLPIGLVPDADRSHAAVARQRGNDAFLDIASAVHPVYGLQPPVLGAGGNVDDVAEVALHGLGRVQPVQRIDREIGIAQPAETVVPVAAAVGRLRDRGGECGEDRPGIVHRRELQRDRRADDLLLPFERDAEVADPVAPVSRRLLEKAARHVEDGTLQRFVRPEHESDGVLEHERDFLEQCGDRAIGRGAQRKLAAFVAHVVAAERRARR